MNASAKLMSDSRRIAQVILHYAAVIARDQRPEKLLHLNAAMARDLVGADRCSIWLADLQAKELYTKIAHGIEDIRIPYGRGLVGACVLEGKPIIVNDTTQDSRFLMRVDKATGYRTDSLLVVPLLSADGGIIGALEALNKPGGFSTADADLLGLFSWYAAAVIEGQRLRDEAEAARLLYRELEVARDVQQAMFPKNLPPVPDLDYAATCRAAKLVGGDYYDALLLPGGNVAFTIGDVSGKGMAAALVMAGIQSSLRGALVNASDRITRALTEYNRTLYGSTAADRYSTLFCALYDSQKKRLNYVNCGHPLPILRRANGKSERLCMGGPPIGLLPVAKFEEGWVMFAPGDVLVCFSDGFSEATDSSGEMWEDAAMKEAVRTMRGSTAKQMVDHLFTAADEFSAGAEQYDDMTVVVLRAL